MRKYETVFLKRPALDSEKRESIIEKIKDIITENGGEILETDDWGKKTLAYEIENETEAYYYLIEFSGDNKVLKGLRQYYNISVDIIRNMIVKKG
ncbi:MAG: 30S ribosomal protein S6 [Candidatus Mcinerneyibacterium aminivorans]|jgi:small subunit ribosomal protein S6|uniref:Small ribosomal subunit protein bS6 n=1 Tax=Candidatus Mcinerneyibacterium aminivorans TaxID=2703815 RepID=A0A5D0ML34_9BACT|nr:MAG: 30S ribosomal protein S6 [Candidatus Mcinerneyibacterium aminivorans]